MMFKKLTDLLQERNNNLLLVTADIQEENNYGVAIAEDSTGTPIKLIWDKDNKKWM